jgi:integrase
MAGMRKKGDGWHCTFRFRGKRYYFATGNLTEQQAKAKGSEVDETLDLIERGRLSVPDGVKLEDFVAAGGKVPVVAGRPEMITVRQLFDHYLKTHGNGTIETSSLKTAKTHLTQLAESFGERFRIQSLTVLNLQEHVERRRKMGIAAVTIKKEVATLRACWNWATHGELVKGIFPGRGLRFPKEEEKEPFRTFAEIEAIIASENPDDARKETLWHALYLTRPELESFLAHVKQNAILPWVYPMIVFAAYTGARRSEILRALVSVTAGGATRRWWPRTRAPRRRS